MLRAEDWMPTARSLMIDLTKRGEEGLAP